MFAHLQPLVLVERAGLVEQVPRHLELADVVEERRPAEQIAVSLRDTELGGEKFAVGAHAFAVSAREAAVLLKRRRVGDDRRRRIRRIDLR